MSLRPDAVLRRVGFLCPNGEEFNVSKNESQPKVSMDQFAAATIEIDNAAWLNLLLESEQRKDQLKKIQAEVAAARSAHQTMIDQYQKEYTEKNKAIIAAREDATRHKNQLIVVARALCPILRQFLLQKGAMPKSGLLPCGDENERNAREMLSLLEPFSKM